jgi:hypothetical protein
MAQRKPLGPERSEHWLGTAMLVLLLSWTVAAVADEAQPFKTIPGEVPPELRIPPYLPAPPPLPPPKNPPVQRAPPPAPDFAPGLPQGPVTNFGTGGMQAPPGAPPYPPYPAGGLMR